MKKLYYIGVLACMLTACKPNLSTTSPTKGSADFSRYIAVGNSLTAGFADGALYRTGQLNSYPQRLSEQFRLVGGGAFNQPLLNGDAGYDSTHVKLSLGVTTGCDGTASLAPVKYSGARDPQDAVNIANQGPFNNLGIPGIRVIDYLVSSYGAINPFSARMFREDAANINNRPLDELIYTVNKINPTFFTSWLGNNDVLGYALGGGQGNAIAQTIGVFVVPGDITPIALFEASYDSTLKVLTKNGAKGAIMNIPDVTSIPFFTTIPANGLTLTQTQADALNAQNTGTLAHFSAGANYFLIRDHNNNVRQATAGELILLTVPQDSITCHGYGSTTPIPALYVLTNDEVTNIKAATNAFNQVIQQEAVKYNLALVDMNSYLKTIGTGITYNGVKYNAAFASGGAFSLDGIHLTPRGYAIVANQIIQKINSYYQSGIPMIDVNKYNGVLFP